MKQISFLAVLCTAACAIGVQSSSGQDFRISTRVFNEATRDENAGRSPVVSRSLTLFHAGKVYDYLDSMGEVIVLEPKHNRFTILNTSRHMAATVNFDEIKRMLKLREDETNRYIEELVSGGEDFSADAKRMLEFQMDPEFETDFDPSQEATNTHQCDSDLRRDGCRTRDGRVITGLSGLYGLDGTTELDSASAISVSSPTNRSQ